MLTSGQSFLDGFLPIVILSVPALLLAFALLPILVKWMLQKRYSGFTLFVTRPLEKRPANPEFRNRPNDN